MLCLSVSGILVSALFAFKFRALNFAIERCLSYDEKPLLLFQKLKESGQKPVFMLRHIVSPLPSEEETVLNLDHSETSSLQ
jgi:hypothetical protein